DILLFQPEHQKTDPNLPLTNLDRVLKKHSIICFLSDMEVLPKEQLLRQIATKHDFIAFSVEHPAEYDLPAFGFIELQTAEMGRPVTIDSSSEVLRNYLHSHGETRHEAVEQHFAKCGIDLLRLKTNEDY